MNWERQCLRLCAAALLLAVGLRLASGGAVASLGRALENPEVASFLIYLQTGRVVRLTASAAEPEKPAVPTETAPEPVISEPETDRIHFQAQDLAPVRVNYNCALRPDLTALLTRPLKWNLRSDEPSVLILHTHATESFSKSEAETYKESSPYRTLDPSGNMLCIGQLIAELLENAGIPVIHDQTLHDYPDYSSSYDHAAASTGTILEDYPSIRLILDLHRDAADTAYGQMVTHCTVDHQDAAQLMMVVGTNAGPLDHPDWEQNLSLALKLQVLLEQENPGICRDLNLTSQRYNQHLGEYALLIEVGAAGNTLAEAKLAAAELAKAIIRLADGT